MSLRRVFVTAIAMSWIVETSAVAQVNEARSTKEGENRTNNQTLGISFLKVGTEISQTADGYRMLIRAADVNIRQATAEVTVSTRPFVDLPGSFGGKLYLDGSVPNSLLKDRIRIDSIDVNGLSFVREYWAVYAGMGAWEGVINCYASVNSKYYVISLDADLALGKPGEVHAGKKLGAEELQTHAVGILNNTDSPVIQEFQNLVSSFRVNQ